MMIKQTIRILCAAVVAVLTACSSDSRDGDIYYLLNGQLSAETTSGVTMFFYDHGDGTVSVTYDHSNPMHVDEFNRAALTDYVGDIVIPETVTIDGNTYRVVGITEHAFMNNTQLKSVKCPASVSRIGQMAFYNCKALEDVTVGGAVTELVDSLFFGCSNLTSVTLPEGLTTIGVDCFHGVSCEMITLPSTLKTIGKFAFNSAKLTYVDIPASVTELTDSVFCKCSSLKKVLLPETLQTLGVGTFAGCRTLSEVTLPASITTIGEGCFSSIDTKTGESNWKNLTLIIKATVPPVLKASIANANTRRDLIVPRGSREAYEQADYWSEFTKIFERNF